MRELLRRGCKITRYSSLDPHARPFRAACHVGHTEVVELLLSHNADVDEARVDNGNTPLIVAAMSGHTETVRMLLRNGADPYKSDSEKRTAVELAAQNKHADVVRLLVGVSVCLCPLIELAC